MSGKLKEVRLRIASVKSTAQITKAMKLVAAAKLRKAQEAITEMRPYSEKLSSMLSNIVEASSGDISLDLASERDVKNVLIVSVTSNRGLCGGFNSNVIKETKRIVAEYQSKGNPNITILSIGKKGTEVFAKFNNVTLIDEYSEVVADLSFEKIGEIAENVMAKFENSSIDEAKIIYTRFKNAAVQQTSTESFLPITQPEKSEEEEVSKTKPDFTFEPDKKQLINILVPKILKTQLFKTVLDSNASEQGARMTAMDQATENANELIKDLKIEYNRARQAAITTELTEIVSGAAALEG